MCLEWSMNRQPPPWLGCLALRAGIVFMCALFASADGSEAATRYELKILADHYQIYLQDDGTQIPEMGPWRTAKETWTRRLAVAPGLIAVDTASYRFVPVVVEGLDKEPSEGFGAWEHVVEASLDVKSGRLVVYGPTQDFGSAKRIALAAGSYRVRVSSRGLSTVPPNGLTGDDSYRVQLWRVAGMSDPAVLKQGPTP
jgi:hypothetical protein